MDFNYEIDSCDAATLNESVVRKKGILDKWKEIRGYFTHYPEKVGIVHFPIISSQRNLLKITILDERIEGNIPRSFR